LNEDDNDDVLYYVMTRSSVYPPAAVAIDTLNLSSQTPIMLHAHSGRSRKTLKAR